MEAYVGQIVLFAGNFEPRGWRFCDGRLLDIKDYRSYAKIVGTTYGGDGTTTVALPDLRGRLPVHANNGGQHTPPAEGETVYTPGSTGGAERIALTPENTPSHRHRVTSSIAATSQSPENGIPGKPVVEDNQNEVHAYAPRGPAKMGSAVMGTTGQGEAHDNVQPYAAIHFIVCVDGMWPPYAPDKPRRAGWSFFDLDGTKRDKPLNLPLDPESGWPVGWELDKSDPDRWWPKGWKIDAEAGAPELDDDGNIVLKDT